MCFLKTYFRGTYLKATLCVAAQPFQRRCEITNYQETEWAVGRFKLTELTELGKEIGDGS